MAEQEYNYSALDKVFKMTDSELAHEFLIKKTPEEIKAYDEYMSKLPEDKRKRIVDPFVTAEKMVTEMKTFAVNNRELLPTASSIDNIDFICLAKILDEKYRLVVRNPRKYKLNYEVILMYYDELLLDNWETFDKERLSIINYLKSTGETKRRTRTPLVNFRIVTRISEAISSINLDNVYEP